MAGEATGADQTGASGQETETQGTDTQGGETPDYAGFQTPEELANAYQDSSKQLESYQKQVADLERIKGQNSGAISQLNEKVAVLTGQLEGMKTAMPAQSNGPTLQEIASDLEDGKLTDGQALQMAVEMTEKKLSQTLSQQYQSELKKELESFQDKISEERAVEKFLKDNPGYLEAYDSGKLDPWMKTNPDGTKTGGKAAWLEYQLQATHEELKTLKEQAAVAKKAAEAAGLDKGIQLEKSKGATNKVLKGNGGKFSQVTGNYDLNNAVQRNQAGQDLLTRMRSGA